VLTLLGEGEGNTVRRAKRKCRAGLSESETWCMQGNWVCGTREAPTAAKERSACGRWRTVAHAWCGRGVGRGSIVCWAAPRSGGLKSHWRPG